MFIFQLCALAFVCPELLAGRRSMHQSVVKVLREVIREIILLSGLEEFERDRFHRAPVRRRRYNRDACLLAGASTTTWLIPRPPSSVVGTRSRVGDHGLVPTLPRRAVSLAATSRAMLAAMTRRGGVAVAVVVVCSLHSHGPCRRVVGHHVGNLRRWQRVRAALRQPPPVRLSPPGCFGSVKSTCALAQVQGRSVLTVLQRVARNRVPRLTASYSSYCTLRVFRPNSTTYPCHAKWTIPEDDTPCGGMNARSALTKPVNCLRASCLAVYMFSNGDRFSVLGRKLTN